MQKPYWSSLNFVLEAFDRYRQNPYHRFVVNVRRHQANKIRDLLKNNSLLDLKTFHEEVWSFESKSYWLSQHLDIAVFPETKSGIFIKELINGEIEHASKGFTWANLEEALSRGDLELHGHYIWHQGGQIYEAGKKTDNQKLAQIHTAIGIINSTQLTPLRKAEELLKVGGLGECNATGLVMMVHPQDFSVINSKVTRKAFQRLNVSLGANEKHLAANQALLLSLKNELGAIDFLELDWFLFLITRNEYPQISSPFMPVSQKELMRDINSGSKDQIIKIEISEKDVNRELEKLRKLFKEEGDDPLLTQDNKYDLRTVQVRDSAFSRSVRLVYDSKCVVCGAAAKGPNEQPEVECAHIYPKSSNGSDHIRNGLCLCRRHHWAFDVGWFVIDDDYSIIVNDHLPQDPDYDFIRDWSGKKIFLHPDKSFWPHIKFLRARRGLMGF